MKEKGNEQQTKTCNECGEKKPLDAFSIVPSCRGGRNTKCKTCISVYAKNWHRNNKSRSRELSKQWKIRNPGYQRSFELKTKYGITADQYDQMVDSQDGRCLICFEVPLGKRGHSKLHVDHCHLTGRVRGLLCGNCNIALGLLKEDADRALSLVGYIKNKVDMED